MTRRRLSPLARCGMRQSQRPPCWRPPPHDFGTLCTHSLVVHLKCHAQGSDTYQTPGPFLTPIRIHLLHHWVSAVRNILYSSKKTGGKKKPQLGSNLFPLLLVFPVGIIQNAANLFFNGLSVWASGGWKCSCSSLNCCLRATVITVYVFMHSFNMRFPLAARIERKSV